MHIHLNRVLKFLYTKANILLKLIFKYVSSTTAENWLAPTN